MDFYLNDNNKTNGDIEDSLLINNTDNIKTRCLVNTLIKVNRISAHCLPNLLLDMKRLCKHLLL